MSREALVAWVAGFLDGEGHFKAARRYDRVGFQPGIAVTQVASREPLERCQELFGGSISFLKAAHYTKGDYWLFQVAGAAKMRSVLPEVIPYLTVKRREAELTLALASLMPLPGHRLEPGQRQEQEEAAEAIVNARREARVPSCR